MLKVKYEFSAHTYLDTKTKGISNLKRSQKWFSHSCQSFHLITSSSKIQCVKRPTCKRKHITEKQSLIALHYVAVHSQNDKLHCDSGKCSILACWDVPNQIHFPNMIVAENTRTQIKVMECGDKRLKTQLAGLLLSKPCLGAIEHVKLWVTHIHQLWMKKRQNVTIRYRFENTLIWKYFELFYVWAAQKQQVPHTIYII